MKVSLWVTAMNKNWEQIRKVLIEFGLTPAARTRVGMATSTETDPFEEFLRARDCGN